MVKVVATCAAKGQLAWTCGVKSDSTAPRWVVTGYEQTLIKANLSNYIYIIYLHVHIVYYIYS